MLFMTLMIEATVELILILPLNKCTAGYPPAAPSKLFQRYLKYQLRERVSSYCVWQGLREEESSISYRLSLPHHPTLPTPRSPELRR